MKLRVGQYFIWGTWSVKEIEESEAYVEDKH